MNNIYTNSGKLNDNKFITPKKELNNKDLDRRFEIVERISREKYKEEKKNNIQNKNYDGIKRKLVFD
jgi:hypothetical protein